MGLLRLPRRMDAFSHAYKVFSGNSGLGSATPCTTFSPRNKTAKLRWTAAKVAEARPRYIVPRGFRHEAGHHAGNRITCNCTGTGTCGGGRAAGICGCTANTNPCAGEVCGSRHIADTILKLSVPLCASGVDVRGHTLSASVFVDTQGGLVLGPTNVVTQFDAAVTSCGASSGSGTWAQVSCPVDPQSRPLSAIALTVHIFAAQVPGTVYIDNVRISP